MGSDSAFGEPFYKKEELYQRKKFRGKRMGDGKLLYGSLVTGLFFGLMVSSDGESMVSCAHIFDPDVEPDYDSFGDFDDIDCELSPETVGQLRPTPDVDDNPLYVFDVVESEYMRYVVTDIGYDSFVTC